MLLARLTFRSKSRLSEEADEAIRWMPRVWRDGGQVLGTLRPLVFNTRSAEMIVRIPERHALSIRHALPLTKAGHRELAARKITINVDILGEVDGEAPPDRCRAPRAYVLFTHAYTDAPPVRCADCFLPIPLYHLPRDSVVPPRFNTEYSDLLTWQRDFNSMDNLWFDSGFGERWSFRQLSNPKSELNRDGLSVRESLEDRTGRKVYYFLFAHCNIHGDALPPDRPCPICGGKWLLKREVFTRFSHKCERCRIVTI